MVGSLVSALVSPAAQVGELELLVPPPPSSAAVVAFGLKFLAGYGNTLLSSSSSSNSSSNRVGPNSQPLASFGVDAARDGGLGMQRLVSTAGPHAVHCSEAWLLTSASKTETIETCRCSVCCSASSCKRHFKRV
jgi:hypothetical protein